MLQPRIDPFVCAFGKIMALRMYIIQFSNVGIFLAPQTKWGADMISIITLLTLWKSYGSIFLNWRQLIK